MTKEQTTVENQGTEPPQDAMEERRNQTPGTEPSYSGYRVPKPRTFTGAGDNEDGNTIDSWIREVKAHFNLAKTPEKDHATTLQFWLGGRAKDYYWAKRQPLLDKQKVLNINGFLKQLRKHIVPATEESTKWKIWNNIRQVQPGGKIRKITDVAVEIESTAWKLGASIGPGAKVQKLLDAMHPILQRAVEPHIKREDRIDPERWESIVEDAELQDDILYSTKAYDAKRETLTETQPKSAALEPTNQDNWQPKPKWKKNNRKRGTFGNNPTTKKGGKTCFYCGKTGHFIKECRKKKRDQEGGRQQYRTAVVHVGQEDSMKQYSSFKEYQQSQPISKASTSAIGPRNNDMVTTLRINNGKAKVQFDTGTTGTHLLSNAFVQTNGIQTEAMQPPVIIRLATKGSKTVAKDQVTCTVEIAPQIKVKTQFLVVPIKEYQAIMGMPFLQQHEVKLDTANGTAIFGKHRDYIIRCNEPQSAAILVTAAAGTNEETVMLPDFTKEFPNVFPEREQ
jgi:hypothetical protein